MLHILRWLEKQQDLEANKNTLTMETNNTSKLDVLHSPSLRDLIVRANSLCLKKENIVKFQKEEDGYFLIYFK